MTISVHADSACGGCASAIEHTRHTSRKGTNGETFRSMCSWAGRLFSSLIVTSHRNEIKGSITFNWTTIFSFRSYRIAWPRSPRSWPWSAIPISVYFAYRLRSAEFGAEIELTRNSVTWIERNVYVGITWDCTWWSTCTRERSRIDATKVLGQVFCMSIVVRFVGDFKGFLGDSF